VQKSLRWRKGVTRHFSIADHTLWQSKIRTFLRRPAEGETALQKKQRLHFAVASVPKQATFNWLRDVSNSMACVAGARWQTFMRQEHLLEEGAPLQPPQFCVICTDEESKQIAGINYLKWKKGAFVEHVRGPIHRRTNDATLGFKESDLYKRMCVTSRCTT